MSYIYIASPYSSKDPEVMQARYEAVVAYTAAMFENKELAFSPIVHCHPLALLASLPRDIDFWELYDRVMVSHSSGLHMLRLPGWAESKGCQLECDFAGEIGLPIRYVSTDEIYEKIKHLPGVTALWGALCG